MNFSIDSLFSKLTNDRSKKLKYLIQWLDLLYENYDDLKSEPASYGLFHSVEYAYLAALKGEKLDKNLEGKCDDLRAAFPESEKEYFCKVLK